MPGIPPRHRRLTDPRLVRFSGTHRFTGPALDRLAYLARPRHRRLTRPAVHRLAYLTGHRGLAVSAPRRPADLTRSRHRRLTRPAQHRMARRARLRQRLAHVARNGGVPGTRRDRIADLARTRSTRPCPSPVGPALLPVDLRLTILTKVPLACRLAVPGLAPPIRRRLNPPSLGLPVIRRLAGPLRPRLTARRVLTRPRCPPGPPATDRAGRFGGSLDDTGRAVRHGTGTPGNGRRPSTLPARHHRRDRDRSPTVTGPPSRAAGLRATTRPAALPTPTRLLAARERTGSLTGLGRAVPPGRLVVIIAPAPVVGRPPAMDRRRIVPIAVSARDAVTRAARLAHVGELAAGVPATPVVAGHLLGTPMLRRPHRRNRP